MNELLVVSDLKTKNSNLPQHVRPWGEGTHIACEPQVTEVSNTPGRNQYPASHTYIAVLSYSSEATWKVANSTRVGLSHVITEIKFEKLGGWWLRITESFKF